MALKLRDGGKAAIQAAILLCTQLSCSLFQMNEPTIVEFTPEEGYIKNLKDLEISLTFSADMDKTSVEEGFSLTKDGENQEGKFHWQGTRMTFIPSVPLQPKYDYRMLVETSAEDADGNNLASEFSSRFTTRKEHKRPKVTAAGPADGSVLREPRPEIEIRFTEPMDRGSVYTAFETYPKIDGTFGWEEDGSVMKYAPSLDLAGGTEYRIELTDEASDMERNRLGEPFIFSFRYGVENTPPVTVSAGNEEENFSLTPVTGENPVQHIAAGWERWWNILLEFSEEVSGLDIEKRITLSPSPGFSVETRDGGLYARRFVIIPPAPLPFDEICFLRIDGSVETISGNSLQTDTSFYFKTDGPGSLPPEVTKLTFLADPAAGLLEECTPYGTIDLSGYLPHPGGMETGFFDIYLRLAESASLVQTECMEQFSIETSADCASLAGVFMQTEDLTGPAPDPEPQPDEQVLRVYVTIYDNPACGTVTLRLDREFKDSKGNHLETEWVWILNEATS